MMDDLKDRLMETFEQHTTEPRQLEQLLATATRRGHALRRRRRLAGAGTGVAALIVVAALVLPQLGARTAPPPKPVAAAPTLTAADPRAATDQTMVPTPPIVPNGVTAADDPNVVDSDLRLIHVGLSKIPAGYAGAHWLSMAKIGEGITLVDRNGDEARGAIFVGRHESDLDGAIGAGPPHRVRGTTVHGQRAEVLLNSFPAQPHHAAEQSWYVRWQERPGLWAQTSGSTRNEAVQLANAARFDTVYQCVVPARVTVPRGLRAVSCDMTIVRDPKRAGGLAYQASIQLGSADHRKSMSIAFNDTTGYLGRTQRTTARGRTAYWARPVNGHGPYSTLSVPGLGGFTEVRVDDGTPAGPSAARIRSVFAGVELHGRPDEPLTWATRPVR